MFLLRNCLTNFDSRLLSIQKHDKPKYVLCLGFTKSGVPLSGDSNGNIHIWTTEGVRRIERVVNVCGIFVLACNLSLHSWLEICLHPPN